ncbi:MAG TPA: thioredoxin family protein [Rhizomicrobium sp.]|jgi:thiol:disulfide interchange protein|nr:thioredoxin family protein [Rhizomicrobium sp.]
MILRSAAFVLALVTATIPAAAALRAPALPISNLSDLSVPDRPFDESANADVALAAALARAKAVHKRVLIDLDGNWCADCRILAGIMELPDMRRFLVAHYVVVMVDVGRFNKNLQVPARFGITERLEGVPAVLIAAPDGTLVNKDHIFTLDDARSMTPQAIADWLSQWAG